MKKILLTKGYFAIVDDSDFEWLNQWKWHYSQPGYASKGKPYINGKPQGQLLMHRLIMKCPDNKTVDHINQNKLDNRKKNLRICSYHENRMNSSLPSNNTSGFKGVYFYKGKWSAQVKLNGKMNYVGRFINKEEAAKAYNQKAAEFFGEFANLNQI